MDEVLVRFQTEVMDAMGDLAALEHEAVGAYHLAISRLKHAALRARFVEFVVDHQRHIEELNALRERLGERPVTRTGSTAWLSQGRAVLADLFGDAAILRAMRANEDDSCAAYERLLAWPDLPEESATVLARGLADVRRHRRWIEEALFSVK